MASNPISKWTTSCWVLNFFNCAPNHSNSNNLLRFVNWALSAWTINSPTHLKFIDAWHLCKFLHIWKFFKVIALFFHHATDNKQQQHTTCCSVNYFSWQHSCCLIFIFLFSGCYFAYGLVFHGFVVLLLTWQWSCNIFIWHYLSGKTENGGVSK